MIDLSIAIVSYNTKDVLLDCLRSVHAHTHGIGFEVIVVDNDSRDGTVAALRDAYPGMRIIANPDNRGFAKAVNQAQAVSRGRHILLLNSDTIVSEDTFAAMVEYLDHHPNVGAVNCKQRTGEGHVSRTCFPFPSLRDHVSYCSLFQRVAPRIQAAAVATLAVDSTLSQDVDWANGACLMVRLELLRTLGGLDEGFFMYFEDIDLCKRIHRQGYRVHHLAEAEIVHLVGRSSGRVIDRLNLEWELSRILYVEKHFSPVNRMAMKCWIAAGIALRMVCLLGGQSTPSQRRQLMQNHLTSLRRLARTRAQPEQLFAMSHERRS